MNTEHNYLTPEELIKKYPEVKDIGWTSSKIGVFFSGGLLQGKHCKREKRSLIRESSFIDLIDYYNVVLAKNQIIVFKKDK